MLDLVLARMSPDYGDTAGYLIMLACLVGWIISMIAMWRAMRAHEDIASSLRKMSEKQNQDVQR